MVTSFPKLIAGLALFTVLVVPALSVSAQIPAGSSARDIPTAVQQSEEQVSKVIKAAEDPLQAGQTKSRRQQARSGA